MKNENSNKAYIGTVFTALLFLVFILCALFSILIGARVYKNINMRNQNNFDNYITLQYVANKIRQGDVEGGIKVEMIEGSSVLEIFQKIQEDVYVTKIYTYNGNLMEILSKADAKFALSDGVIITDSDNLQFYLKDNYINITSAGDNGEDIVLKIRSGDNYYE